MQLRLMRFLSKRFTAGVFRNAHQSQLRRAQTAAKQSFWETRLAAAFWVRLRLMLVFRLGLGLMFGIRVGLGLWLRLELRFGLGLRLKFRFGLGLRLRVELELGRAHWRPNSQWLLCCDGAGSCPVFPPLSQ